MVSVKRSARGNARDLEPERVERARAQPGDLIDNVVRINVENVVGQVRGSTPILAALVDRSALTVVGAVYSLDTERSRGCRGISPGRWPGAKFRAHGNAP